MLIHLGASYDRWEKFSLILFSTDTHTIKYPNTPFMIKTIPNGEAITGQFKRFHVPEDADIITKFLYMFCSMAPGISMLVIGEWLH